MDDPPCRNGGDDFDVELQPLGPSERQHRVELSVLPHLLHHAYAQLLLLVVAASTLGTTSLVLTAEAATHRGMFASATTGLFGAATTLLLGDVAEALVFGMFHFPYDSDRTQLPPPTSMWNLSPCDYHPFFVFLLLQFFEGVLVLVAAVLMSDASAALASTVIVALAVGTLTVGALILLLLPPFCSCAQ